MFPRIQIFSPAPARAPEIQQSLLPQTDAASTSQQPKNEGSTPPGSRFSLSKPSWLNSTLKSFAGNTKLHQAAQAGDLAQLQALLGERVDPGKTNNNGQTALHCAVENGHLEIVKALLANPNSKPNEADQNGRTSLSHAVENGPLEIVEALLDHPSVESDKADNNMRTPLSYAAEKGRFNPIALLLKKGANPNLPDKNGLTPFDYAVTNGQRKATETMLQNTQVEFDLNLEGLDGKTLLRRAIESNNPEIIKLFLDNEKLDINKADKDGATALHHAVDSNNPEIIKLFLDNQKLDINKADKKGATALHQTVKFKNTKKSKNDEIIKLFLDNEKLDINKADKWGDTALHYLVDYVYARKEPIELFLQQDKINPNLKNLKGHTPIAMAAMKDAVRAVRTLIDSNKVDINEPNNNGETPFFLAIKNSFMRDNKSNVFDLLVENAQADLSKPRNDGMTPSQYIEKYCSQSVSPEALLSAISNRKAPGIWDSF